MTINTKDMDTYGKYTGQDTIRFERILPGPIERVWSYLTDPEKRSKWLASGPMDVRVGGAVRLEWYHKNLDATPDPLPEKYKHLENGHSMDSLITRCEPPHLLAFQWGKRQDALSEVVIELSERGKEVLLVLTHERLPNQNDLLGISGGWHGHLDILEAHLNGRTSEGFWKKHMVLSAEYERRLTAKV